ncbi:MAG: LamG domain-containing protein [Deltaproteobacteria bacterium]|nr:MAG: LamG domain-containing protein [Deltaproteobacteria bacterium]
MRSVRRWLHIPIVLALALILSISSLVWAGSAAVFSVIKYVFGNAGNFGASENYDFGGTMGEMVIGFAEPSGASQFKDAMIGFWPTVLRLPGPIDDLLNVRALWKLDEGHGDESVDLSCFLINEPVRNNLMIGDDAQSPVWIEGPFGWALYFDGIDDHADAFLVEPDVTLNQAFSVEAWFYLDPNNLPDPGLYRIISQRGYPDPPEKTRGWEVQLLVTTTGWRIRYEIIAALHDNSGTTRLSDMTSEQPFPSDPQVQEWHHFAVVRSPLNRTVALYLDGEPSIQDYGPLRGSTVTNEQIIVGAYQKNAFGELDGFFRGGIDDIRVTDYPLFPDQIGFMVGSIPIPRCDLEPVCPSSSVLRVGDARAVRLAFFFYSLPLIIAFSLRKAYRCRCS